MALDERGSEAVDAFGLAVVAIREHSDPFWESGEEIEQAADDVARQLIACGADPVSRAKRTDPQGLREFIGEWQSREPLTSSILYWVGHGHSNGVDHYLVTSRSGSRPNPADSLVTGHLAAHLREDAGNRGNVGAQSSDAWTVLILDTCSAGIGLSNIGAELMSHPPTEPKHLMILATTDGGSGYLNGFGIALSDAVGGFATNDPHIRVKELIDRLVVALGERAPAPWGGVPRHALICNPNWHGRAVTGPIDAVEEHAGELREAGRRASGAEQPGAELVDWFTGRARELAALDNWLGQPDRSLQVVTGSAGSGKSALVKRFLAGSQHELDATLLATGKTIREAVQLIAADLFDEPVREPGLLLAAVERMPERRFLIAVDSLDEAIDPHVIAATLLRPLARLGNVKLLVATRRSPAERQGAADADDRGILEALGSPPEHELELGPDAEVTRDYVLHYLRPAFPDGGAAERLASLVVGCEQPLLFARLVVTELLAAGAQGPDGHLERMIDGDIATVFAAARRRLDTVRPELLALLRALVFSAGRGLPRLGDVWLTVAQALHPDQRLGDTDIAEALMHRPREKSQVAPYIMLDTEHRQSTYRLSHRALLEQFERDEQAGSPRESHTRISGALLESAEKMGAVPAYTARYLPWHLARSEPQAWRALAACPAVLDGLVPGAVAAEAMNVAAEHSLPPEVLGLVASRHRIVAARYDDREGLRQIGMATCAADGTYARPVEERVGAGMAWGVRSAVLRPHPIHLTLQTGSRIASLACLQGPEGIRLLAAGCQDGSVHLWNVLDGEPFGAPIGVSKWPVLAIAGLAASEDAASYFAVGDGEGQIRVWDTLARRMTLGFREKNAVPVRVLVSFRDDRGELRIVTDDRGCAAQVWSIDGDRLARFEDHSGEVLAIAGPPSPNRAVVASAGEDDTVRLWNPVTGEAVGGPLGGHQDWVTALARFEDGDGRDVLVSGGDDGVILVWDISNPSSVKPPRRIDHPGGRVRALCAYRAGDGAVRLVSGGQDGTVRVWDPVAGGEVCGPLTGHAQHVTALAPCGGGAGMPARLASVAEDDRVCVWNPGLARPATTGPSRAFGAVNAIATQGRGDEVVAGGGDDGTVRFWNRDTGLPAAKPVVIRAGAVRQLVAYRDAAGAESLASADGDVVVTWRSEDPSSLRPLYGHEKPVCALAGFRSAGGALLLASGDQGGEIRIWDATSGDPVGEPIRGPHGPTHDIAAYVARDGDTCLVAVGERTIRAWSLRAPAAEPRPLGEHTNWVLRVAAFVSSEGAPRVVTAGADATMRLWDPEAEEGKAQLDRLNCGSASVRALAVCTDAEGEAVIAGGGEDGSIWLWRPTGKSPWQRTIPLKLPIRALAWRGEDLLVGTAEGHAVLHVGSLHALASSD